MALAMARPSAELSPSLFASDFDGTKFLTSESADDILSVDDAYAVALDSLLGPNIADKFLEKGGHLHRTPAEIILSLCQDMSANDTEVAANVLTKIKLDVLMDQVGKPLADGALWPRPTDGFTDLWSVLPQSDGLITTADISAGHAPFIHRVYDQHGLQRPDLVITDEFLVADLDLGDTPPEERAKPAPLLLEVAKSLWLEQLGSKALLLAEDEELMLHSIIYVGDSKEKDGGLAENCDIEFVLLEPELSVENWAEVGRWLGLGKYCLGQVAS